MVAVRVPSDDELMARALFHARRGAGRTTPNPLVGAVVVTPEGVVVGTGYHRRAGEPHAEVFALDEAGAAARGGTLYCTLEPCCHVGRTGPCAVRIAEAGIARVVAAHEDPHPVVGGGGFRYLRARGIRVDVGCASVEARRLNGAFLTTIAHRRPFVTLKIAMSADGCVAAAPGCRTTLTGREAQRHAHLQRAEADAIAVGSETIRVDDPLLTVRGVYRERPFTRVILDRRLRTPPAARVLSTLASGEVIIVATAAALDDRVQAVGALAAAGARIESSPDGTIASALTRLAALGITSIILEGGPTVQQAAWEAGVVDRIHVYRSRVTLGTSGVRAFDGLNRALAAPHDRRTVQLGNDTFEEAYVHGTD